MEREASYGRSGFALQFMLDTRLSDAERYPLKVSDLIIMDVPVNEAPEKLVWVLRPANTSLRISLTWPSMATITTSLCSFQRTFVEYAGSVMSIDPSGRGKDETGYAVVKMLNASCTSVELAVSLVVTMRKPSGNYRLSLRKKASTRSSSRATSVTACSHSSFSLSSPRYTQSQYQKSDTTLRKRSVSST